LQQQAEEKPSDEELPTEAKMRLTQYMTIVLNLLDHRVIITINPNVLIAVYLFVYLYACYSHNSKSIKPNRM